MLLKVNLMQSNDKRLAIDITDWFGSLLYFMNSSFQKSIDIIFDHFVANIIKRGH